MILMPSANAYDLKMISGLSGLVYLGADGIPMNAPVKVITRANHIPSVHPRRLGSGHLLGVVQAVAASRLRLRSSDYIGSRSIDNRSGGSTEGSNRLVHHSSMINSGLLK